MRNAIKHLTFGLIGFALAAGVIIGDRAVTAATGVDAARLAEAVVTEPHRTNEQDSGMLSRACAYNGTWTEVDCSGGAAYSAQLNANSRYVVQAQAGLIYFRQGTAASGQDAAAGSSFAIPIYGAIDIYTRDGRYFSCDGSGASGKAYYDECQ